MGIGKITRDVGKVGAAIEVARFTILAGYALWSLIRGKGGGASSRAVLPKDAPPSDE